jgi:hypothetical protein
MLLWCRVIKTNTDDGLLPLRPGVAIGDKFLVDLDTRQRSVLLNNEYGITHEKELVQEAETGGWLPVECVQLFLM